MRIISGSHKGRPIYPPKNFTARPTTDFAKESLFNILNNQIIFEETVALDLFSGTGGITYELASRDCKKVIAVEIDYKNYAFIKGKLIEFGFQSATVVKRNAFDFLKRCHEKFDLIFADPPYELDKIETIPELVFSGNLLNENGLLIVEHSKSTSFNDKQFFIETRTYGSVNFSFFRLNNTK